MSSPARAPQNALGGFLSRSAMAGVFGPALAFEVGIGAVTPMVAVSASQLGASLALAGLLAAFLGIGQILGDVPAGAFAARFGDRRAMLAAAALAIASLVGCATAHSLVVLGAAVLVTGGANAVFLLARQAYLTEITPPLYRARALSTLGGVGRMGVFLGPFLGAGVVHLGGTPAAYWLAVAMTVVTVVVVAAVPDVAPDMTAARREAERVPLRRVLRQNRSVFATLGAAVLLVGATRGARQVVLPLWGEHLGLAPATTSLVYGVSGALDMLVFYPAGKVMDRRGRLWVAVPSMLLLGLSIAALPLAQTVGTLAVVAMVMGLANGVGSGLLMTLGADVAPPEVRSQFLGVWRLFQDAGLAAGPLVVSAGAALGSLVAGVLTVAGVGGVAAAVLSVTVPRWSVHANGRTRRAAGLRSDGTTPWDREVAPVPPASADGGAREPRPPATG